MEERIAAGRNLNLKGKNMFRVPGFGVPSFMVQDVPGWTSTNYDNYSTSIRTDDAGLFVHVLYGPATGVH
jgi:hypothetical protein